MIHEYHRPESLEEALALLARSQPKTIPLAGGSSIPRIQEEVAVVDLQRLGLGEISVSGNLAELGAMVTYQQLMEWEECPSILVETAHRAATINLRNQITIGGTVASHRPTSPVLAALLALDARIAWIPGDVNIPMGEWLPLRNNKKPGLLIKGIYISINLVTAAEMIAKTPGDIPQVMVCGCKWPSGRIRMVGWIKDSQPNILSDGRDVSGVEFSSINLAQNSSGFSEEYLMSSVSTLIKRVQNRLES